LNRRTLVIILVGLALLLIAATIKSGWLYLVASVLFALAVVGVLSGWLAVRGITISREAPAEAFEGKPFDVSLRISNNGRFTRRLVTVDDLQFRNPRRQGSLARARRQRAEFKEFVRSGKSPERERAGADEATLIVVEELPPGELEVDYRMSAPRRGVYQPARLRVGSGGVLGSAEVRKVRRAAHGMTIFPTVFPLDSFRFDPRAELAATEAIESSRKGIGHDYYGIREYSHGDSLRYIHWRSSARMGKLIVKEYEQELRPSAAITLALLAPEFGDGNHNSLEDGLRAAASIIGLQESMGSLPMLVHPRGAGFEAAAPTSAYGCYELLAQYQPPESAAGGPGSALRTALEATLEAMLPGSAMIVVTNAPPLEAASALEAFGDVPAGSLVLVLDDSYGPRWKDDWLDEAPWLAAFAGMNMNLYAVVAGREMRRCLTEPLNTIA
jgi:uncharacterized protein (DUF58 family)